MIGSKLRDDIYAYSLCFVAQSIKRTSSAGGVLHFCDGPAAVAACWTASSSRPWSSEYSCAQVMLSGPCSSSDPWSRWIALGFNDSPPKTEDCSTWVSGLAGNNASTDWVPSAGITTASTMSSTAATTSLADVAYEVPNWVLRACKAVVLEPAMPKSFV